jgi:molecular chaperone DnaK (HSP70)
VGIDLGTTSSVVAVVVDGKLAVLEDEFGRSSLPSIVAYPSHGANTRTQTRQLVLDLPTTHALNNIRPGAWPT